MRKHSARIASSRKRIEDRTKTALLPAVLILLWVSGHSAEALTRDQHSFRAGIRNISGSHQLDYGQRMSLIRSLSEKTGLATLRFDEAGFLVVDDRSRFFGGSRVARSLLFAALDGDKVIKLENYSHNQTVFFASIGNQQIFKNMATGQRIEALSLRLDFFDFGLLQGDSEALASFDVGMVVLHELGHTLLNLKDNRSKTGRPGACIGYTNNIRTELDYPLRQTYMPEIRNKVTFDQGFIVQLTFIRRIQESGRNRMRRYNIFWNADRVGVLDCAQTNK